VSKILFSITEGRDSGSFDETGHKLQSLESEAN